MPSDKHDDEKPGGASGGQEHKSAFRAVESKWLGKQIGRQIEVYSTRAPRVEGVLMSVDERFGRLVIANDSEEVIVWLGNVAQIRMPTENGKARGAQK